MNQYQLLNKAGQLMVELLAAERHRQDEKPPKDYVLPRAAPLKP